MTCLPTTYDGYKAAVGWYCAARIIGQYDAGNAAYLARKAIDPNYKPNPFADKPTAKSAPKTTQDSIDAIRARVNARKSS